MDLCLKNKVVLVTGGSRGIGRAIATRFAEEGARVLITYGSSSAKADELVGELTGKGLQCHAYQVDVRDTQATEDFVEMVGKEFEQIDVLVNNAGIIRDTLIMSMEKEDWDQVIGTNLTGVYNTIKPVARLMMRKRSGSIINLSSIAASRPGKGHSNYAATKGGVESMTMALAQELSSRKIRVNCVAPGMIETDMSKEVRDLAGDLILDKIALKRYGQPNDIADTVMFLASERAAYITGEILHVDGGVGA
jgi:3-oxoacyl-[acyl-carrier protein] reductase